MSAQCADFSLSHNKTNNSNFNLRAADVKMKAEVYLRDEGNYFMLLSKSFDGMSCDSNKIIDVLLRFLKGEITYETMNETKHNVKSFRFQALLEGSIVKPIGSASINGRMVKVIGTDQETSKVKDWADNSIVLHLCSAGTVLKIIYLKN